MSDFDLVRVSVHEDGAFGVLLEAGIPFALTLERTYDQAGGAQLVKIPPGTYECRRRFYNRGGYESYEVTGVPGHSLLLFHKGNLEHDSEGCILVGTRLGMLGDKPGVLQSWLAFDELMERARGRAAFSLTVREVPS